MGAAEVAYFFPATADSTSTEWKFLLYLKKKTYTTFPLLVGSGHFLDFVATIILSLLDFLQPRRLLHCSVLIEMFSLAKYFTNGMKLLHRRVLIKIFLLATP